MFKVNNKKTGTTPSVSIVNFEQLNAGWVFLFIFFPKSTKLSAKFSAEQSSTNRDPQSALSTWLFLARTGHNYHIVSLSEKWFSSQTGNKMVQYKFHLLNHSSRMVQSQTELNI